MSGRISADVAQELADQLGVTLRSLDASTLAQRLTDMLAFLEELDEAVAEHPDAMMIVDLRRGAPEPKGRRDGPV